MNEQLKKIKQEYIKHEMTNYQFYQYQIERIERELVEIGDALNDKRSPGSIIKISNRSVNVGGPNWIVSLLSDEQGLIAQKDVWQNKIKEIDRWLSLLPENECSLVRTYIIKNRCKQAEKVAAAAGYTKDGLLKMIAKAIQKIATIL